jgi:hypothetical protein
MLAAVVALATPAVAYAAPTAEEQLEQSGFTDPRKPPLPRTHRFRMGLELDYVRLSAALDEETGESQRFHYIPLQVDFAYQAQFLKWFMARPSLAMGPNVGNSLEAMPFIIHPQIHLGYQGRIFGAAFGYGFFFAPVKRKDAISSTRGGLGQPIITNNHHVGGELSITTRIHKRRESAPGAGQFSLQLRIAAVQSTTQHFELRNRRWRVMPMLNAGWYFGDGRRARERRRKRRAERQAP